MGKKLSLIMDAIPLPVFVCDGQGQVIEINLKMEIMLGRNYNFHNLSINSLFDMQSSPYLNELIHSNTKAESKKPFPCILLNCNKQKGMHVEINWKKISIDGENLWLFIVYNVDASTCEIANLKLQATRDELTGINNRWNFFNKFDEEIKKAKRYKHTLSLMLLDIDHFKNINDTHGHLVGDRLLKTFCLKIEPLLRESDVFARLGGDEFAILMPETTLTQANQVASRIKKTINSAIFSVKGEEIELSSSIGVSMMSGKDIKKNILLERCDIALYKAKYGGRNKVVVENLCVA